MKKKLLALMLVALCVFNTGCSSGAVGGGGALSSGTSSNGTSSSGTSSSGTSSSGTSSSGTSSSGTSSSGTSSTETGKGTSSSDVASAIRALEEEKFALELRKDVLVAPDSRIECTTCADPDNLETCSRCDGKGYVWIGTGASSTLLDCSCSVNTVPGKLNCPTCSGLGTMENPYYDSEYYEYKQELDAINAEIKSIEAEISRLSA